jgi:hypothetical protein
MVYGLIDCEPSHVQSAVCVRVVGDVKGSGSGKQTPPPSGMPQRVIGGAVQDVGALRGYEQIAGGVVAGPANRVFMC